MVVSLPALQSLSSQSGTITSAVATVDSLDNLSSATTAIKNSLGSSADVESALGVEGDGLRIEVCGIEGYGRLAVRIESEHFGWRAAGGVKRADFAIE